jgi:hypothetical protein
MRRRWLVPVLGIAGLSAVSAVFAHAGPAAVLRGPWFAAAMAGALVSAAGLTLAGLRLLELRRSLDRLAAGDLSAGGVDDSERQLPLTVLLSAALVCQGGAHVGLLLAGVHSHSGVVAAPALHVLLGFVSALVVYGVGRLLALLTSAVAEAIRAALALLAVAATPPRPHAVCAPRTLSVRGARHSRAPPAAA